MKIYVYKDRERGHVKGIELKTPVGKSAAEISKAIDDYNAKSNDIVEAIEVDDTIYEAFSFLLGKKHYRGTYDMTDLIEHIDWLKGQIADAADEIGNISTDVENICQYVKTKLNEKGAA